MPFQKIKISKKKYDRMIDLAKLINNAQVTAEHFRRDLEREMQRAGRPGALPMFLNCNAYFNSIDRLFTTNN